MKPLFEIDYDSFAHLPPHRLHSISRVMEFIGLNPKSTVRDIAKGTGLSQAAIRYILIDLVAIKAIITSNHLDEPGQRNRGRPAQRYLLNKTLMITTPPRRFWQLSDLLISTMLKQLGENSTTQIFRDMGEQAARTTAESWRRSHRFPMSINTFRKRLGETLDQLGYNALLAMKGKRIVITTHNCLYSEISRKYEGLICNFHNSYYPTLFSLVCERPVKSITRSKCMAEGDECCYMELLIA